MKSKTSDIKAKLRPAKDAKLPFDKGLSTGSTLLNLSCSGRMSVGFLPGYYYFFVGDSNSGKTFWSMGFLAEACKNPIFDNHRLIFNSPEHGSDGMNIRGLFGKKLAERLEPPATDANGHAIHSYTVEDWYDHMDDLFNEGKPFIEVLDSEDCLGSEAALAKFTEQKTARRKGKETTGSYGDGKAKVHSSTLRTFPGKLRKTDSMLIIISQTRDNIGFGAQFEPKTRSGGHALSFYATIEMWSSIRQKIKKPIKGTPRQIGINSKVKVKRSRFTGKERSVEIPIYWSSGVDDIGSCIEYLVKEGHWKKDKSGIVAEEFDFEGSTEKLVELIESQNKEKSLRMIVAEVWNDIEAQCAVPRKVKYE